MRANRTFFTLSLGIGLGIAPALSLAEVVAVERVVPAGDDDPQGHQIVIRFNQSMVATGSLTPHPPGEYAKVEPATPCQCRAPDKRQ